MRIIFAIGGMLLMCASAAAQPSKETYTYAIVRKGEQIGTNAVELRRNGQETVVNISTKVEVKVMFITAYRYQHSSSERWVDGRLVSLASKTDDNGTPHRLNISLNGSKLSIDADGKKSSVDADMVPISLWNPLLVKKSIAMDTVNGSLKRISVSDHGIEELVVQRKRTKARHYSIQGQFEQEVWYDDRGRLVQTSLTGRDGSLIVSQLM
jgi:hypothetical protein